MWGSTHHCQVLLVTSQLMEMLPTSYIALESGDKFSLPWKQDEWSKLLKGSSSGIRRHGKCAVISFPESTKGQINKIMNVFDNIY